jgi:hypothetical protein
MSERWKWLDEDKPQEQHTAAIEIIVEKILRLKKEAEEESFDDRRKDAFDDALAGCDTDEEAAAMVKQEQTRIRRRSEKIDQLENALAELGARMARPYEHWNEEEQYREYMEVGRFAGEEMYG